MTSPRLRFAPSPTGYLHVGGARTALFNWLYARRHGGVFILRIEDTDVERSSGRNGHRHPRRLAVAGHRLGRGPRSRRPARAVLPVATVGPLPRGGEQLLDSGQAFADGGAIRFKVPPARPRSRTACTGRSSSTTKHIESFVILRSDTHPTYHLSVVVDDIDMEITHVVRGDDHISNTPKQVLLYHALRRAPPHLRARAADPRPRQEAPEQAPRRHLGHRVREGGLPARGDGELPRAARLGPGSDDELFTRDELVERFTLEGIRGGNAVFNPEKLDWFNHQHLLRLSDGELIARLIGLGLEAWGLGDNLAWTSSVLTLLRPRCKKLTEFAGQLAPFFVDPAGYDADGVKKHLSSPEAKGHLQALRDAYAVIPEWTEVALEKRLRELAEARAAKAATLIHGARLAMTGRMVSPGLFEMLTDIRARNCVTTSGSAGTGTMKRRDFLKMMPPGQMALVRRRAARHFAHELADLALALAERHVGQRDDAADTAGGVDHRHAANLLRFHR